jgi:uncharacterized protein YbjT (DUF2867 family)
MKNITAVTGASGAQGKAICAKLSKLGHEVIGLTRSSVSEMKEAQTFRSADLDNQQSLENALRGVDSVVYTYPVAFDAELARQRTRRLIDACKAEDVHHVTFNASIPQPTSDTGVLAIDLKPSDRGGASSIVLERTGRCADNLSGQPARAVVSLCHRQ